MRKNIVVIGLILLVIGIVMVGVESVSIEHSGASTLSTQTTMIPSPNGEYHSNLLSVNKNQIVTVVTNSKAYLIPASDISIVNESNVNNYAISPFTSSSTETIFENLNGSYYVVVFSNSTPAVTYMVGNISSLIGAGVFIVIGGLLFIVGIVVIIIGAILKPKQKIQ